MEHAQVTDCITREELKQLIDTKQQLVKLIDVREKEDYDYYHIPNAINITILNIELASQLFDKNDFVVTACGKGGGRSAQAMEKLYELGFTNVKWLCGGTIGWKEN